MQAGVYRATSPVIPPSAAWGMLLNLAGIECRDADPPPLRIAVGVPQEARARPVSVLYQQLHSYPVGASGKQYKARCHGSKYWIAPVTRELIANLDVVLAVEGDASVLGRIRAGVLGTSDTPRHGLLFAGDNNFLVDDVALLAPTNSVSWYARVTSEQGASAHSCRLAIGIDRQDQSRSTSALFAPTAPTSMPPDAAWTWTPASPL